MAEIVVDAANFAAVFRANEKARSKRVTGAIFEAAIEGAETVVVPAAIDAGKDTGSLASSIEAKRIAGVVQIVADAPHAGIIEAGARPHMPPLQPIVDWVRRHAEDFDIKVVAKRKFAKLKTTIDPRYQARRDAALARREAAADKSDAMIEAIANAIRWKIFHHGSRPHWFMKNSLPRLREILVTTVERRIRD